VYHFYFSLPKNDKNAGTVFLPMKSSVNVPVIISCYGWNKIHWPKRMDEGLRDRLVNKSNMGFVTMELSGESDDNSRDACGRWANNLSDMIDWVKAKTFTDGEKIGLFAYGFPAIAALQAATMNANAAFVIVTLSREEGSSNGAGGIDNLIDEYMASSKIPMLFLQGTNDKITIQTKKAPEHEIIRRDDEKTKSTHIIFRESDFYLYNIVDQATDEIVKWLNEIMERV